MSNRRIYSSQPLTPHIQVQHSPVLHDSRAAKPWRVSITRWPGRQHTEWHSTVEAAWKEAAAIIGEQILDLEF